MNKIKITSDNENVDLKTGEKYTLLYFDDRGNIKMSYIKLKSVERCKYSSKKNVLKLIYRKKHSRQDIIHYLYGRPISIYKGWKKLKGANFDKIDKKFDVNSLKKL